MLSLELLAEAIRHVLDNIEDAPSLSERMRLAEPLADDGVIGAVLRRWLVRPQGDLPDVDLQGALHWAAAHGHPPLCALLLAAGAAVDFQDATGETALRRAAWFGQRAVIATLLRSGAGVNVVGHGMRYTPLMAAARFGYVEAVAELLAARADVAASTRFGSAHTLAAEQGHQAVLQLLVASEGMNEDGVAASSEEGTTVGCGSRHAKRNGYRARAAFEAAVSGRPIAEEDLPLLPCNDAMLRR